jgi:hypothetical protein
LVLLQFIQKRHDEGGINLLEAQAGRRLAQPLLDELQELTEGVAIGTDGMWTRLALLHQALGKETLQKRSQSG